jgi:hypothetical protein
MDKLRLLYDKDDKPVVGQKFVAFFNDGSGASLYQMIDEANILSAEGAYEEYADLIESYLHWLPIPDDFKFWAEENE